MGKRLVDVTPLVITGAMLAITVVASIQYYRLIRRTQKEYDKARGLVEDVVMSFNRELRKETDKIDTVGYRIEGNASKIDVVSKRVGDIEKQIAPAVEQLGVVLGENQRVTTALNETNTKVQGIQGAQETLKVELGGLREQMQKLVEAPELKIEPVIPLRRDRAMAALTDTEIAVLEMLVAEGAKTAPEIKERVQLSREHTARLMKKLYEEGYLERETGKIPFKYDVKKEMESLLKKTENTQS